QTIPSETETADVGKKASFATKPVKVVQGSMVPLWLHTRGGASWLILARYVRVGDREFCQGILLDWPKLQGLLATEVKDFFPEARFQPLEENGPPHPERTMTALPVELEPGPASEDLALGKWTPLRAGLAMSWVAALLALLAVGLGGWSLIDLS